MGNQTVSSGDTAVVSTHHFTTHSSPWEVPILGEGIQTRSPQVFYEMFQLGGGYSMLVQIQSPHVLHEKTQFGSGGGGILCELKSEVIHFS